MIDRAVSSSAAISLLKWVCVSLTYQNGRSIKPIPRTGTEKKLPSTIAIPLPMAKRNNDTAQIIGNHPSIVNFIEKENVYEPIGDIEIVGNELNGVEVSQNISWLIDELPALSIAMSLAKGTSKVKNAKELRVKESDRIKAVVDNLALCGVDFTEFEDGYEIRGGELKSATIDSYGDHRIAMSFAIAGLNCDMKIDDVECINSSFPNFKEILDSLY